MIDPNLTKAEVLLLEKLKKKGYRFGKIERQSDKPFDLRLEGTRVDLGFDYAFSAWLPLLAIRELTLWTSYEVARFSRCYADMAMSGDWSGIRDAEPEEIWEMFENCVDIT